MPDRGSVREVVRRVDVGLILYCQDLDYLQVDQAYADRLVADALAMAPAGGFTDE